MAVNPYQCLSYDTDGFAEAEKQGICMDDNLTVTDVPDVYVYAYGTCGFPWSVWNLVGSSSFMWHMRGDRRMSIQVNTKDLMNEGLVMVAPSDPIFDDLMTPAEESTELGAVKPYSVLIQNTGKQSVIAFVVRWDLVKPDGRVDVRTYKYSSNWSLMGRELDTKSGKSIRPGAAWLLAPGLSIEIGNMRDRNPVGQGHLLARIVKDLSGYASMTASLDGAFFDDGTFVGPNSTGFFEQVVALRDARRDLLNEIDSKGKSGANHGKIFSELQSLTEKTRIKLGKSSTLIDYYNKFKADFAEQVIRINKISGSEEALKFALESSGRSWPTLRKGRDTSTQH
jgi:hypothetical protein